MQLTNQEFADVASQVNKKRNELKKKILVMTMKEMRGRISVMFY